METAIHNLGQIVANLDFNLSDVRDAFQKLDLDKTGLLTYTQFLQATLEPSLFADETLLEWHFKELDAFQEGFLTKESIKVTLQRKGTDLSVEVMQGVFEDLNLSHDAKINFDDFKVKFGTKYYFHN